MRKIILHTLAFFISCSAHAAVIKHGDLLTFPTRPGVTQSIYVESPSAKPEAVVLLYSGGDGILSLGNKGATNNRGNFVIRTSSYWLKRGYAAVLVDAPSDMQYRGMEDGFRWSADTLVDQKAIFDKVREQFPSSKLILVSTSRGTVTVGNVLQNHPDWADLYVLTSAESSGPHSVGISNLKVPKAYRGRTLMVANRNDVCRVALFHSNEVLAEESGVKFIAEETDQGGGDPKSDCGGRAPHGYLGGELKTLNDIQDWIRNQLI